MRDDTGALYGDSISQKNRRWCTCFSRSHILAFVSYSLWTQNGRFEEGMEAWQSSSASANFQTASLANFSSGADISAANRSLPEYIWQGLLVVCRPYIAILRICYSMHTAVMMLHLLLLMSVSVEVCSCRGCTSPCQKDSRKPYGQGAGSRGISQCCSECSDYRASIQSIQNKIVQCLTNFCLGRFQGQFTRSRSQPTQQEQIPHRPLPALPTLPPMAAA